MAMKRIAAMLLTSVLYLRMLEATKVSSTGHLYFIPRQHMDKVDTFETFIEQLSAMNQNDNSLSVNSFYIIDDAKQRDKMTEEFYSAVKKEIALYQEKADYLIQSGSRSPAVMERWVGKIATLEQKKQHYEEILRRSLTVSTMTLKRCAFCRRSCPCGQTACDFGKRLKGY